MTTTPTTPSADEPGQTPASGVLRPGWYLPAWLDLPGMPTFQVLDTRSAQGRLDLRPKQVTLADLILFHGHACDGLLRGIWAMRALGDVAFGKEAWDRSDLLVVSKNSPCLGDVAAYLTGGRVRFGTHRLDDTLRVGFQVQVVSTGETWEVREEQGFFPDLIAAWESALLEDMDAGKKQALLAVHEAAQWDWCRRELLPSAPSEHYTVTRLPDPELPAAIMKARRTDTLNRTTPAPVHPASPYELDLDAPLAEPTPDDTWVRRYQAGPD